MRVSIATLWCDPTSGICEVERPMDPAERAKHTIQKLYARNVQIARCDVEGCVVFVVYDGDHARLEAGVRAVVVEGLVRHHEGALVAIVGEGDTDDAKSKSSRRARSRSVPLPPRQRR